MCVSCTFFDFNTHTSGGETLNIIKRYYCTFVRIICNSYIAMIRKTLCCAVKFIYKTKKKIRIE